MQTHLIETKDTVRKDGDGSWPSALACLCFLTAVLTGLTGSALAVTAWWDGVSWLGTTGTALLVAMIGLTLIGAHFLDLAEADNRSTTVTNRSVPAPSQIRRLALGLAGAAWVIIFHCGGAQAQQTIFNVPTTDVLDRGKVYFELDVSFKFPSDPNNSVNRFSSAVPRIVVGAGHKIEIGLNIAPFGRRGYGNASFATTGRSGRGGGRAASLRWRQRRRARFSFAHQSHAR
ncbi:MAG: hypothetical protein ABIP75_05115 [Pyrinomonadaceae bacterium]